MIGKKFGRLKVISFYEKDKNNKSVWKCKCDCGNEKLATTSRLNSGGVKSCGCLNDEQRKNKLINIKGKKFGRLKVLKLDRNIIAKGNTPKWKCICDCGNIVYVTGHKLIIGHTKSCGCLKIDKATTHGYCGTKLYSIWEHMKARCDNENHEMYRHYGGRNIIYDTKWNNFLEFKKDMYNRYNKFVRIIGEKNITIERIEVNGNYNKNNCTFIHKKDQAKNKRNSLKNRK